MLKTRVEAILERPVSWEELDRIVKKIGMSNISINPEMFELLVKGAAR